VLRVDASDGVEPWRAFLRPSRATGNKVLESESGTQAEELRARCGGKGGRVGLVGWWRRGWTRSMWCEAVVLVLVLVLVLVMVMVMVMVMADVV
jgi:hypothetical protein